MCGRYTLTFAVDDAVREFNVERVIRKFSPSFNVAPGQKAPVIIKEKEEVLLETYRWGFIPHWARDEKIGYKMINARAETLAQKPSFKGAFLSQRVLVPAAGFFEWEKRDSSKTPHYITLKDRGIFAFAGISSQWESPQGKSISSFSIITTRPNQLMEAIHDRMPVILPKDKEQTWLNNEVTDIDELKGILRPYPDGEMQEHIVSSKINSPINNYKDLLEPVKSFNQALDKWV